MKKHSKKAEEEMTTTVEAYMREGRIFEGVRNEILAQSVVFSTKISFRTPLKVSATFQIK
ncbi:MAG: hypothetical protein GY795_28205 [Desulfobacterales bacterium]|nr:hypothetical protein [Desulfobacterales bacterium]